MTPATFSITDRIGVITVRVLVPLWLIVGAAFKLFENSPSSLPQPVMGVANAFGLDLVFVLHYAVAVELVIAGVIWFLPRLARLAGVAILSFFAVILLWEVFAGAASCGCLGSVTVPPWVTLVIDGALLVAVLAFGKRPREYVPPTHRRVAATLLWTLAAFAVSFGLPPEPMNGTSGDGGEVRTVADPPAYYMPTYESWVGRPWEEVELSRYMPPLPDEYRSGLGFLVFYRKDCDHCHTLLEMYFAGRLPAPTTVVAVPNREGFPTSGTFPQPCGACSSMELPAGCDWVLATPVVVRLEDGVVTCAAEEDPAQPRCVGW